MGTPNPDRAKQDVYAQRDQCPCCGAHRSGAERAVASTPTAESLRPAQHGAFLSGFDSARIFFTYYRCTDCEALYCPVYYSGPQLEQLYARQSENMSDTPLVARLRTHERYADIVARYSRLSGDFLEIGSDVGLFAELLARRGTFDRFWLYEPNREVHAQLANRLRSYNCTIRHTGYRAADIPAGSVSTAGMIHVLDHLFEPARLLRDLRQTLEPEGVLFIVTHDATSLLARVLGRRWPPYTLQHPHLFSPRALRLLLESCGYKGVEIVKTQTYMPLSYLLRAGLSTLGLPSAFLPNSSHGLLTLPLGNIAAVARNR